MKVRGVLRICTVLVGLFTKVRIRPHAFQLLILSFVLQVFIMFGIVLGSPGKWVWQDPTGKLQYSRLPFPNGTVSQQYGDRIMDFSVVGYNASNSQCCPHVAATHPNITVKQGGTCADIQHAIDSVAQMELQGEFRGVVVLEPGIYKVHNNETVSCLGGHSWARSLTAVIAAPTVMTAHGTLHMVSTQSHRLLTTIIAPAH